MSLNAKVTEYYYKVKADKKEKNFDILVFERDSNKCSKKSYISYQIIHLGAGPFAFFDRSTGTFGPSALFLQLQNKTQVSR